MDWLLMTGRGEEASKLGHASKWENRGSETFFGWDSFSCTRSKLFYAVYENHPSFLYSCLICEDSPKDSANAIKFIFL